MAALEERVSRLEGIQRDAVTKSDLADLEIGLKSDLVKAKVEIIKWVVGVGIGVGFGVVTLTSSIILIGLRIMVG